MKNLQITPPEGYEIDESKSTFSNIVFKPIITKQSALQRMKEIWKMCTTFKYSSDNCRTYFMGEIPMIQQDWKNKKLYYNYTNIYLVFRNEYNLSEDDINTLVIGVVSKDLNCNNLATEVGQGVFIFH